LGRSLWIRVISKGNNRKFPVGGQAVELLPHAIRVFAEADMEAFTFTSRYTYGTLEELIINLADYLNVQANTVGLSLLMYLLCIPYAELTSGQTQARSHAESPHVHESDIRII
jgi:hypothetical protein